MREIKFRAWDKRNSRFLRNEDWYFHSAKGPCLYWNEKPVFPDDLDILQYTGLMDKNGKEIYEGDIVKINSVINISDDFFSAEETEFIIFCKVVWIEEMAGFDLNKIDGDKDPNGWTLAKDTLQDIEVISNIYEHPKLISPEAKTSDGF